MEQRKNELQNIKVINLKELCKKNNLTSSGPKEKQIERILNMEFGTSNKGKKKQDKEKVCFLLL